MWFDGRFFIDEWLLQTQKSYYLILFLEYFRTERKQIRMFFFKHYIFEVLPVAYFALTHNLWFPSKSISSDILRALPTLTKECFYKHTFNNEIYAYFTFMGNHYHKEIDFPGGQTKKNACRCFYIYYEELIVFTNWSL